MLQGFGQDSFRVKYSGFWKARPHLVHLRDQKMRSISLGCKLDFAVQFSQIQKLFGHIRFSVSHIKIYDLGYSARKSVRYQYADSVWRPFSDTTNRILLSVETPREKRGLIG